MSDNPTKLTIRAYQVGFGDCFLLTFHYAAQEKRHVLIDFGTTGLPPNTDPDHMLRIAKDIQKKCTGEGNKLSVVVATHRHKDHISGFSTNKKGNATGDIIRALAPDMVILPWTEDPDLPAAATAPWTRILPSPQTWTKDSDLPAAGDEKGGKGALPVRTKGIDTPAAATALRTSILPAMHAWRPATATSGTEQTGAEFDQSPQAFMQMLTNMNIVAEGIVREADHLADTKKFSQTLPEGAAQQIRFLAEDNAVPNASAVQNLQGMEKPKPHYVYYGAKLDLGNTLPGVCVKVLGPPTLEHHAEIKKARSKDPNEFWMLQASVQRFWGVLAASSTAIYQMREDAGRLFPDADYYKETIPIQVRWIVRRMREARGGQLLEMVRILDQAMNNTSVILLFEVGQRKFLFSGDAQIENWEYALKFAPEQKENLAALAELDFYKVGHHGSRNATPKTLWNHLKKRTEKASDTGRLRTMVSTMGDHEHGYKHGCEKRHTEVPRQTLIDELTKQSDFLTTQTAATNKRLYVETTFDL